MRPAEADAVAAERFRYRAHVAARAQPHRERRDRLLVLLELELVDRRPPCRHLDRHAAAMEPVRALAADLGRRGSGDLELDLAAERIELRVEVEELRRLVLVDDVALGIAGGCRPREVDRGLVALLEPHEPLRLLREAPEQHEQEPGRERVERPGVTSPRAGPLAELTHDRERRRAGGLVVEDEARGRRGASTRHYGLRRTLSG